MKGVKSENLLAIVDFLYCGETNVYQENLDSFLAIAEELKMKGLLGQKDVISEINMEENSSVMTSLPTFKKEKTSHMGPQQNQTKKISNNSKGVNLAEML